MICAEIIIPCYNESANLNLLFKECCKVIADSSYTVSFILVDNGSSDNTKNLFAQHSQSHRNIKFLYLPINQGYGGGILAGLQMTQAPIIGWTHADLQTPLADCLTGLNLIDEHYGLVKGVRVGRSMIDKVFSRSMEIFESVLFQFDLKEINAQPTVLKREIFEGWHNPPKDFSLDLYALVMAHKANINTRRINVRFLPRQFGSSKWNLGIKSKIRFIARVIHYSLSLRRAMSENL